MQTLKVGQTVQVEIESLSFNGGRGIGRVDGMVIFVPWSVPGDRLEVEILENKKTFLIGKLKEILVPSTWRREPKCKVFGRCGGCVWQNVAYERQIWDKQIILESSLRNLRKTQEFEVLPLIAAPNEFAYRNRIQLNKKGSVGFFERGSNRIAATDECPIAEDAVSQEISRLKDRPDGRYEISRGSDGEIRISEGARDPETALFSQVNSAQNEKLIEILIASSRDLKPLEVWDLYCGSGNLTVPLAKAFGKVTGVELSRDAIAIAKRNAPEVKWIAQDIKEFLTGLKGADELLVVLDPPRTGVDAEVSRELGRIKPKNILYVSCNPMTFARDAQRLCESGMRLRRVQGLDMFPQTEHVELIAWFTSAL